MGPKFIIVNNGMTGLRGHYYETGVSIAREAQKRGFQTGMATHATCDADHLPPGLEYYPLFRVDHWGAKVAGEVRGVYGIRASLGGLRNTTIEDVLAGAATMEEYLLARFEPLGGAASGEGPAGGRARLKRIGRRLVPPFAVPAVGWLVRNRRRGKDLVRRIDPAGLVRRLGPTAAKGDGCGSQGGGPCSSGACTGGSLSVEARLRNALERAGAEHEADLWPLFLRDLDRLICLADVRADDHMFLPTAHGREAFAIGQLIREIGEERAPRSTLNSGIRSRRSTSLTAKRLIRTHDVTPEFTARTSMRVELITTHREYAITLTPTCLPWTTLNFAAFYFRSCRFRSGRN